MNQIHHVPKAQVFVLKGSPNLVGRKKQSLKCLGQPQPWRGVEPSSRHVQVGLKLKILRMAWQFEVEFGIVGSCGDIVENAHGGIECQDDVHRSSAEI